MARFFRKYQTLKIEFETPEELETFKTILHDARRMYHTVEEDVELMLGRLDNAVKDTEERNK